MKLVVDARMISMSGIGRYLRENLHFLASVFDVTLLVYEHDVCIARKLNANYVIVTSKIFSIYEQFEIVAKSPRCDIFWSPQFNVPILIRTKAKNLVTTICDILPIREKNGSIIRKLYSRAFVNIAAELSHKIITISNFSKTEIQSVIRQKKKDIINVIPCGKTSIKSQGCTNMNLPDRYILAVGNVKPHKNINLLIKSFNMIRGLRPDVKLIIVGKNTGFYTSDSEVHPSDNDPSIMFLNSVSDDELYSLYKNAYVYIMPSLYEGFGLPVLEAMGFDIPILISAIPVFKELFGDEVNYFNPYDKNHLAEEILALLDRTLDKPDYYQTLARFDWEMSAEEHRKCFIK